MITLFNEKQLYIIFYLYFCIGIKFANENKR